MMASPLIAPIDAEPVGNRFQIVNLPTVVLVIFLFLRNLSATVIYAFVGVIMFLGIVKKNAIMMIDFALEA